MNKLSQLMAEKVGKSHLYQPISDADPTIVQPKDEQTSNNPPPHGSSFTGIGRESTMSFEQPPPRTNRTSTTTDSACRFLPTITIVTLLVIIYALAGEQVSSQNAVASSSAASLVETNHTATSIQWRPCQIYYTNGDNDPQNSSSGSSAPTIKVLQTSLSDPSNQWSDITCLKRSHDNHLNALNFNIPDTTNPRWNWIKTVMDEDTTSEDNDNEPMEYAMPSAELIINSMEYAHDPTHHEPILGFGGAFTEASGVNYLSLNDEGKNAVLKLLFGQDGLGYSMGRSHINSCDFSIDSYSYDDVENDFELIHFDMDLERDSTNGVLELITKANEMVVSDWGGEYGMRILASPWSPPSWMKTPTEEDPIGSVHAVNMTYSAEPNCLRDGTGPHSKYAKAWALYFSKYISAYQEKGIDIYAITVQNEPEFPAPWEACAYDPLNEASFITHHLGPQLSQSHPNVKLFIFDHNKDHAPTWGQYILNTTSPAANYVDGTALHWYAGGMDRLLDGAQGQPNLHRYMSFLNTKQQQQQQQSQMKSNHLILGSEACHCPSTGYAGGDLSVAWARAERYAHTILADLAAGSNGWIEWNLLLDAIGGPNHLGNLCDAPLLAVPYRVGMKHNISIPASFEHAGLPFGPVVGDTRTREELHSMGFPANYLDVGVVVQPMYYYMGHISRYVRPGSRVVKGLVDHSNKDSTSRTYRRVLESGAILAGGGINNLARPGIEVTAWPCEGSTRQQWTLSDEKEGFLQVFGHDWLGKPTKSCISNQPDESFQGLLLSECDEKNGALFTIQNTEDNSKVKLEVLNSKNQFGENCLIIVPLKNDGGAYGPRGGAQVSIGDCNDSAATWNYDFKTGEIVSDYFYELGGDVCLTTGWPFLQMTAFDTPTGANKKTIVILNEAGDPANYVLRDDGNVLLTNSIPAHSIQTILFD